MNRNRCPWCGKAIMKKLLYCFRKYWICILVCLIAVVGYCFLDYVEYDDLYNTYINIIVPILSLTYGALSTYFLKNVYVPLLIIYSTTLLGLLAIDIIKGIQIIDGILIPFYLLFSTYPVFFSLIGTIIGVSVYVLVQSRKKSDDA